MSEHWTQAVINMKNALQKNNDYLQFMINFSPDEDTGYAWSQNQDFKRISDFLENETNSDGHSGASFAICLRTSIQEIKNEMTSISLLFEKGITGVSFKDQLEGIQAMQDGLGGVALAFDQGTRVAAAETLKRLKLSEEAVGNMGVLAMATGKSFEELEDQQIASVLAAEEELGIRLNLKDVLDETNKITGQTRLNILKFPGGLAKAVSTAKSLGVEMEAISGAAGQLLNFEESIAKELGIPLVSKLPIDIALRQCSDEGYPAVIEQPAAASSQAIVDLAKKVVSDIDQR